MRLVPGEEGGTLVICRWGVSVAGNMKFSRANTESKYREQIQRAD